ncbi:sporulation-specific extracellular nuclease precursor [Ruminiclostridium hungatei]|uniref:Sporulation-specific extracellular nuclease n=1 Tax=Ruminiclostridium hungatei TaxID=48256 RepID=A0A1V4SF40_RUMHU|nr:sporulation-specific extracellular nuclease precursor [Ruminiclostridium hungatei]
MQTNNYYKYTHSLTSVSSANKANSTINKGTGNSGIPSVSVLLGTVANDKGYDIILRIPRDRYPDSAKHIEDAIRWGQPDTLTINREGASANRTASLKDYQVVPGLDRDEYPQAMFKEGGKGADVRPIDPSDNRGSGSYVGRKLKNYPNGTRVKFEVVDTVDIEDDDDKNDMKPGGTGGGGGRVQYMDEQGRIGISKSVVIDDSGAILGYTQWDGKYIPVNTDFNNPYVISSPFPGGQLPEVSLPKFSLPKFRIPVFRFVLP